MTPEQQARHDAFMATFRGVDAHIVAQVLCRFTPGIDWRGCSKDLMAKNYADPHRTGHERNVDLTKVRAEIDAEVLRRARAKLDADKRWDLLDWLVKDVLTDAQLDMTPPGQKHTLRQLLALKP